MVPLSVDLLYTAHNRLRFTQESMAALISNTNWELVNRVLILDDRSSDGTTQFLEQIVRAIPVRAQMISGAFGGPVAAMSFAAGELEAEVMAKIDNDVVVCPYWLDHMLTVMLSTDKVDALGMEPGFGDPYRSLFQDRRWERARWIGGVGLIRTGVIRARSLRQNDRFFGWTAFQRRWVRAAWITPDLPVFLLDHLPGEPWRSLAASYVKRGWQRPWPPYTPDMELYWSWWTPGTMNAPDGPGSSVPRKVRGPLLVEGEAGQ